jgi:glucokinase
LDYLLRFYSENESRRRRVPDEFVNIGLKGTSVSHLLAVDLGGTKCSAAVVDRKGKIVSRHTVPVDVSSPSGPVSQIVQLAKDLAGSKKPKDFYAAAAVAVPGLVRRDGTVWAPNLTGWEQMPLAKHLKRALGIPVQVESDRIAALLGECWRGEARGASDAIVLMIGTGIGAGILSGGHVIRGAHELSGCAGWLTVNREDLPAARGCGELESLTAGPAIPRTAQKRLRNGEKSSLTRLDAAKISAHDVATAARQGDALALDIFDRAGRLLGLAIANLVSVLDPEVVILGGGMAATSDLYLDALRKTVVERAQPLSAKKVRVVVSEMADTVNLIGCAHLALNSAVRAGNTASKTAHAAKVREKSSRNQKEKR